MSLFPSSHVRPATGNTIRWAVVALLFGAAGACLTTGCVLVPGDHNATDRRERPETLVGEAGSSDRPLRLSESTLPNVIAWLGQPLYATVDWRAVVYRYEVRAWVMLAVYEPPRDIVASRFFVVRFAPSGALESCRVYKRREHIPEHRRGALQVVRQVPSPPAPRGESSAGAAPARPLRRG